MVVDELNPGLGAYAAILRRRLPYIVMIAPAIILLSVYLAFAIPAEYRSTAVIMLEPSSVQQELVQTTVASYAYKQIEIVQGRVMTLEALSKLVMEYDPYPQEANLSAVAKAQKIIENTSFERVDPVTLKILAESTAFSLNYDNPDPERAAKVTSKLSDLFLTYNQRTRVESAKRTAGFLEEQAQSVTHELNEVDAQITQLKVKYGEAVPDARLRNETNLDRAQRDLDELQRNIRTAEEKENLLTLQLSEVSPTLVALGRDMTDLGKVKAQLADAEQRYTPDHPEVKRLRRVLEELVARNAAGGVKGTKPNNPEYLRIESQLAGARRELAALRASAERTRQQIGDYTMNLRRSPEVEKEFGEVQRRREVLQTRFQQIQDRLRTAQLAQSFEAESGGERFTLVREPYKARLPVYPNRTGLILLGVVLGGIVTAVVVAIVESADATVRGLADLPLLPEGTVLGSIPIILISPDRRRRAIVWGSVAGVYVVAVVIVGLTIAGAA